MTGTKTIAALAAAVLIICGCSGAAKGPTFMRPAPIAEAGYSAIEGSAVFEKSGVRVTVRHVKKDETYLPAAEARWLLEQGFVLIAVRIENGSKEKVLYDPVHTTLTNDALDYLKPLDYTDIRDAARSSKDIDPDEFLDGLRDRFYDLAVTLPPGEETSRLLIFRPFDGRVKSAELTMKELYVGTTTLRLRFPFGVKGA